MVARGRGVILLPLLGNLLAILASAGVSVRFTQGASIKALYGVYQNDFIVYKRKGPFKGLFHGKDDTSKSFLRHYRLHLAGLPAKYRAAWRRHHSLKSQLNLHHTSIQIPQNLSRS